MDLIDFTAKHEGFRNKIYKCPAGKYTIGYGRNLEKSRHLSNKELEEWQSKSISKQLAYEWLLEDLKEAEQQIDDFIKTKNIGISQTRKEILVAMNYQMGIGSFRQFRKFTIALQNNDYKLASLEMLDSKWAKQTPRRAIELSLAMWKGQWQWI